MTPYKKPFVAVLFRVLALVFMGLGGAGFVVALFTAPKNPAPLESSSVFPAFCCAFVFWALSHVIDYLARTAHHAERAANSLERMEWAAGAPARAQAAAAKAAAAAAETAIADEMRARQTAEESARWQAAQAALDPVSQ